MSLAAEYIAVEIRRGFTARSVIDRRRDTSDRWHKQPTDLGDLWLRLTQNLLKEHFARQTIIDLCFAWIR